MGAGLFGHGSVVQVLVPLALPTLLDYKWKGDTQPQPGDWVRIVVGRKELDGVVAGTIGESAFANLKTCEPLGMVPSLDAHTLAFYRWAARYTLSAPGEPLRVALPRAQIPELPKEKKPPKPKKLKKGEIAPLEAVVEEISNVWTFKPVALNVAQASAAEAVKVAVGFAPFLLDGVTGSGKTEVYLEAIAKVLAEGGQALVLVPEIGLTPQWLARFEERFGRKPWVWHSGLAEGAKRAAWWGLARGEPGIVVGARSALFLPFKRLRLIVVDEEHDPSYKQEEAFRYHARDLAVQLAREWGIAVVLASATPSLETWQRALDGKYMRLILPERFAANPAPVELVDLKGVNKEDKVAKGDFLSKRLRNAVGETIARGEQALLFLNRRGNAPLLLCTECGVRRDCSRCDATLVVHGNKLQCHHCGMTEDYPDECPACGSKELVAYGPGTRRVVAEAQKLWPEARIAVADSDAVSTPKQLGEMVRQIEAHELDIIVGTQMVTKGHHFPNLTLVGVVDGDMGLAHGELRAAERTFQLLTQVAGRAGRGSKAGRVLVQTFDPRQPLFEALKKHDRDGFYALELRSRKQWGDPPFGRQVALVIDGADAGAVEAGAQGLARAFPKSDDWRLLGPAPAPLARLRDKYRWRLLVKGPGMLHGVVKDWVEGTNLPKGVRVTVDVDPVSFY